MIFLIGSLNSCYQTVMSNQMCHTEIMECVLRLDTSLSSNGTMTDGETIGNFGFTLQGASFASDILMQPPVIGYLEPGGVAERYFNAPKSEEIFRCTDLDRVFFNQVIVFLRSMVNS
jgi:hypothetical protein